MQGQVGYSLLESDLPYQLMGDEQLFNAPQANVYA